MSKKNVWIPAMLLVLSLTVALPATAAPSADTPVVDAWRVVATWWSSLWDEIGQQIEPFGGTVGSQIEPVGAAASRPTAGSYKTGPQYEPIGGSEIGPIGAADGSGVGGGTDEIGPEHEPIG